MKRLGLLAAAICLIQLLVSVEAGDVSLKMIEKEPPREVNEAVRKALLPKAVQLIESGHPIYEFWFRQDVPLKARPESDSKSLDALGEVTLLGVVQVGPGRRDYKDNEIAPGIYTIRFGLQPQDGDHLGTAEFPYFAVLIPAAADSDVDGIKKYKVMVKASGKGTATGHPIVLSLRPPSGEAGSEPTLTKPAAEHEAVRIKLNGKAMESDKPAGLAFELVYRGKFKS
jgi:hypothetical protein